MSQTSYLIKWTVGYFGYIISESDKVGQPFRARYLDHQLLLYKILRLFFLKKGYRYFNMFHKSMLWLATENFYAPPPLIFHFFVCATSTCIFPSLVTLDISSFYTQWGLHTYFPLLNIQCIDWLTENQGGWWRRLEERIFVLAQISCQAK